MPLGAGCPYRRPRTGSPCADERGDRHRAPRVARWPTMTTTAPEQTQPTEDTEPVVHILWINAGLSCDGDSVALTAATQPSIEEIVLGRPARAAEGRGALAADRLRHTARSVGSNDFIEWFFKADRGELEPFVLVVEGSIPNEAIKPRGLLVRLRQRPGHRPADDDERVARPARAQGAGRSRGRHLRHLRRHPRDGRQPDRRHGRAGLSRLGLEVQGRASRSSACRAARSSRTTCRRRSSTCSTRRPAQRR